MNPANGSVAGKPVIFSFYIPKCEAWDISSYALIDFMCQKEKDPVQAEKACVELYRRSAPLLLAAARKWEYLGAKYDGEVLVSETLFRAYRKANTMTRTPEPERENEDRRVLFWLFTILKNLILDHIKIKWSQTEVIEEALADAKQYFRRKVPEPWYHHAREFIQGLSETDADILLTSYNYYDFTRHVPDVPADIRTALCRKHKITEANLRTRRKRLIEKLIDTVSLKASLPTPVIA
jgi:DNA-directed RNA polymerase specialized sigma24 family protein